MSVAVVTHQEFAALQAEVKELQAKLALLAGLGVPGLRAFLTPREVAKRLSVRHKLVYDACARGDLVAEKRFVGDRHFYRITHADADRWYASLVRCGDNQ